MNYDGLGYRGASENGAIMSSFLFNLLASLQLWFSTMATYLLSTCFGWHGK